MQTVETTAKVTSTGRLSLRVPPTIKAGEYRVVIVMEEKSVALHPKQRPTLPVLHVGQWPDNLSLRRADFYGDDDR